MAQIGRQDPARLAEMLARILARQREHTRKEKDRFDQQVQGILRREEGAEGGAAPPAADRR